MKANSTAVLIGLGCVWGTSFLLIKVLVDQISPLELVSARLLLGAIVVLAMLVLFRRPIPRDPALWARLTVLAVVSNVIPFLLIAWAEKHIDSGVTSVLNSTMPLFTAVVAGLLLAEEALTTARVLGLIAGIGGVCSCWPDGTSSTSRIAASWDSWPWWGRQRATAPAPSTRERCCAPTIR